MGVWKHVGVSRTGERHRRAQKNTQDRWCFLPVKDAAIIVGADGAGGSSLAEEGAETTKRVAAGELGAWAWNADPALFASTDLGLVRAEVLAPLQESFRLVSSRFENDAKKIRPPAKATDFSTSATAIICGAQWLACIAHGDVSCVIGVPGNWQLVNRIVKVTPQGAVGPARNGTELLPYGSATFNAPVTVVSRAPGSMVLVFTDGGLKPFLVDTTPTEHAGSYTVNVAGLNDFYSSLMPLLCPADPSAPLPVSPEHWLTAFLDTIAAGGEKDDITVIAAANPDP